MLKKILVAVLATNICFSSLAYAQVSQQSEQAQQTMSEELTAEDVALLMTSLDAKPKTDNTWWWVGSGVAVLALAYAVRKIATDPKIGMLYVAAMDPKAYAMITASAKTPAEKAAVEASIKAGKAIYGEAASHAKLIKGIKRGNWWRQVSSSYTMMYGNPAQKVAASKEFAAATKQIARAEEMLAASSGSTATVAKGARNFGKYMRNIKRGGWIGLGIGLTYYTIWGGDDTVQTEINNNRAKIERVIRDLMKDDMDALALFIYNLDEEPRQIAYAIVAENPDMYKVLKAQVEAALSQGNIDLLKQSIELEEIQERIDSVKTKEAEFNDMMQKFMPWSKGNSNSFDLNWNGVTK